MRPLYFGPWSFSPSGINLSKFADEVWLVSFLDYDLGFLDGELNRVEPVEKNPLVPTVLPMLPQ